MSNAYHAAKDIKAKLINDQARLTEKLKTISDDFIKYRAEKEKANTALEQCEKQFIRDEVTNSQLETARTTLKELTERHVAAERMHQLVIDELQKLDRDLLEAQEKIISSRNRFATAERESLAKAINHDTKLRSRLLEIYAAQLVYNNFSTPFWPDFLASIFSPPSAEEAKESALRFKQKHQLD